MNALDLLDAVNWIDRLGGLVLSVYHGGAHTFTIDRTKHTGGEVEALLKRYKVAVFGRRITDRYALFSVPRKQAEWAEYIMLRDGIDHEGPLLNPRNVEWAARHMPGQAPPPWADRRREVRT